MSRSKKAVSVPTVKSSTLQPTRTDINPQLCKVLVQSKFQWTKGWNAEPKFDGLRCWMVVDKHGKATPYSRNGKPLWNMKPIIEEIEDVAFNDYVLDGEVYTKDWNLSMGIVKSSVTEHPDMDKLHFHVWDCLLGSEMRATWTDSRGEKHLGFSSVSNHTRKHDRLWPWNDFEHPSQHVSIVPDHVVCNSEQLQETYLEFLKDGYEGAILKDPDSPYEGGRRSPYWLKIKPWSDADLTVVGSYPGEGKHCGRIGGLVLEGSAEWNGSTYTIKTEVGTGFDDSEREMFQKMADEGNLNGRIVEIKFQDITVEGACRFPVYHRLREDKE